MSEETTTEPTGPERRRDYRLNRVIGAELERDGEAVQNARLFIINISASGFRATHQTSLGKESRVKVRFGLERGQEPLVAEARVAWEKELPMSGMFEVGCEFTSLGEQDSQQLIAFLERERVKETRANQLDLKNYWGPSS